MFPRRILPRRRRGTILCIIKQRYHVLLTEKFRTSQFVEVYAEFVLARFVARGGGGLQIYNSDHDVDAALGVDETLGFNDVVFTRVVAENFKENGELVWVV